MSPERALPKRGVARESFGQGRWVATKNAPSLRLTKTGPAGTGPLVGGRLAESTNSP